MRAARATPWTLPVAAAQQAGRGIGLGALVWLAARSALGDWRLADRDLALADQTWGGGHCPYPPTPEASETPDRRHRRHRKHQGGLSTHSAGARTLGVQRRLTSVEWPVPSAQRADVTIPVSNPRRAFNRDLAPAKSESLGCQTGGLNASVLCALWGQRGGSCPWLWSPDAHRGSPDRSCWDSGACGWRVTQLGSCFAPACLYLLLRALLQTHLGGSCCGFLKAPSSLSLQIL